VARVSHRPGPDPRPGGPSTWCLVPGLADLVAVARGPSTWCLGSPAAPWWPWSARPGARCLDLVPGPADLVAVDLVARRPGAGARGPRYLVRALVAADLVAADLVAVDLVAADLVAADLGPWPALPGARPGGPVAASPWCARPGAWPPTPGCRGPKNGPGRQLRGH